MSLKEDIYDEVAAESVAILRDALHAFAVDYDRAESSEFDDISERKAVAVLKLLERVEMTKASAEVRLAALSPTYRGVN